MYGHLYPRVYRPSRARPSKRVESPRSEIWYAMRHALWRPFANRDLLWRWFEILFILEAGGEYRRGTPWLGEYDFFPISYQTAREREGLSCFLHNLAPPLIHVHSPNGIPRNAWQFFSHHHPSLVPHRFHLFAKTSLPPPFSLLGRDSFVLASSLHRLRVPLPPSPSPYHPPLSPKKICHIIALPSGQASSMVVTLPDSKLFQPFPPKNSKCPK